MKRLIAIGLLSVLAAPGICVVFAADAADVTYMSGTVPGLRNGVAGAMDTTAAKELRFGAGGIELAVPYAEITDVNYREINRFRLGVLPAIAVGALKARSKLHIVVITWRDASGTANVATLEMSRQKAMGLMNVLRARAPGACAGGLRSSCSWPR